MEQLMHYKDEILDYLKKGYELYLYRNPENGLLMIDAIKGKMRTSAVVNLNNNDTLTCQQNYLYELVLKNIQELEGVVNA